MRSILSLISIVALLSTTAYASLLSLFDDVLSGKAPLNAQALDEIYTTYKIEYPNSLAAKYYGKEDARRNLLEEKVKEIIAHNSDSSISWKKGLNEYSDMTEAEFFDYFNIKAEQNCSATIRPKASENVEATLRGVPQAWNWRNYGVVTPVKSQAKCGSCWTFSTVGAMESHYMMKYGTFRNLSEQQLVDCAGDFDNHGCNGGLPSHAFEYIMYAGGLSEESAYPYVAVTNNCSYNSIDPVVGVVGGSYNISTSEVDLQAALFQNGPVSVAF
jgi:cathepsin H